jgi:hypothetical protein
LDKYNGLNTQQFSTFFLDNCSYDTITLGDGTGDDVDVIGGIDHDTITLDGGGEVAAGVSAARSLRFFHPVPGESRFPSITEIAEAIA